jgi:outer membrane protein OmpA-like peptidoglycan-associated protein
MKSIKMATSLLALTLLASPVWSQTTKGVESSSDLAAQQDATQKGTAPAQRQLPPQVQNILDQGTDFSGFTADQLRKRFMAARQYAGNARLGPEVQARMREIAAAARSAMAQVKDVPAPAKPVAAEKTGNAPVPAPVVRKARQPAAPAVDANAPGAAKVRQPAQTRVVATSEADTQARALLADRRQASQLDDMELRNRVTQFRQVLGLQGLSDNVNVALRKRLQADAVELRSRRAAALVKKQQNTDRSSGRKSKTGISLNITLGAPAVVLQDRRAGADLSVEELQHRIQVYRDIESSNDYQRYQQDQRDYWRRTMVSDRELLRRRLLDERHRREAEIQQEQNSGQLNRDIIIDVVPQQDPNVYDDVYAAEADDRQIEDVLIAPPRERVLRRYTVDEITTQPELRRNVPRLEIDTIHFGFGESIVREEEVRNLDRIGSVIEKILKRYPREVFLIEGHTDAVGSDVSNLYLSRARAEAAKQALVTYYDIPAQNLRTAGLGERFLKIQTQDAEAENRRVSISRVTQFIGESQ